MICILGKTASGKTTIVNEMVKKYGFKKVVTYTTRPPRKGEVDNIDYHFVSEEEFINKIEEGFFAEWKTYDSVYGKWYYGTSWKDVELADDKSIVILTPDGYKDIINQLDYRPLSIYIYANNTTLQQRVSERRGKKEAIRRLQSDNEDFKDLQDSVDKIVYNNKENAIDDVVEKVVKYALEAQ